ATALSSASTANLSSLGTGSAARSVTNAVNQNVSSGNKISASKRIAVPADHTDMHLTYAFDNSNFASFWCLLASFNYEMRFFMVDLKNNKTYISAVDMTNPAIANFTTSGSITSFTDTPDWGLVEYGGTATITPAAADINVITLDAGEYIFIKEFYSSNGPNYAEDLADAENSKTRFILDAIAARMQAVKNIGKRGDF